jgi:gluconolactonase
MEKQNGMVQVAEVLYFGEEAKGIFQDNAKFECLGSGFGFSEGPIYRNEEACLYFTDFLNDKIFRWDEQSGVRLYRTASNRAIGLALDQKKQIISCESGRHRIAIIDGQKSHSVAELYQGKRFNSPNDVIVAKNGDIYFTDPLSLALGLPSAQGFNGVYRVLGSGEVQLVDRDFNWPNGLALSMDETILYVNDTGENAIYSFQRESDGRYRRKKEFARLDETYGAGACDGMKVDRYGNVWVTGPAGLWVLNAAGKCIAILKCPEFVGNFCFGGNERKELFITASSSLYRLKLAR